MLGFDGTQARVPRTQALGLALAADAPAPTPTAGAGSLSSSFVSAVFAVVVALLLGSSLRI
ncbi:hypothetical protein SLEP1_g43891 [Rubroshorea leprosula]|uniref:Uncharacterized protein n=1 Tax=Rubroshorea leprosula TaxID=152421 RepID=A0AAV5LEF5_9ROSI|nr:hypothetical protein SLEP1_g43891 [Rubroshorea leprosula]